MRGSADGDSVSRLHDGYWLARNRAWSGIGGYTLATCELEVVFLD